MIQATKIIRVVLATTGLIGAGVGFCAIFDGTILSYFNTVSHITLIGNYVLNENVLDIIRVLAKLLVGFVYFFSLDGMLMYYEELSETNIVELITLDEVINLHVDNTGESLPLEEKLTSEESSLLEKAMDHNTNTRFNMAEKLSTLVKDNDIKLIDEDGNLEMDFPSSMGAEDLDVIRKKVGIMDSIIQTKVQEYEELSNKDLEKNGGVHTKKLSDLNESANACYKNLFN